MNVTEKWKSYGPNIWFKSNINNDEIVKKDLGNKLIKFDLSSELNHRNEILDAIILTDQNIYFAI